MSALNEIARFVCTFSRVVSCESRKNSSDERSLGAQQTQLC